MGVRIITDGARLELKGGVGVHQTRTVSRGRSTQPLSGQFKVTIIYDGTTGKEGLPAALGANEAWLDGSSLYRQGNNFGPTFLNSGQVSCVISGCGADRGYAYDPDAAKVAELTPLWKELATLAAGQTYGTDNAVYSLFRFVFTVTPGSVGSVSVLSG